MTTKAGSRSAGSRRNGGGQKRRKQRNRRTQSGSATTVARATNAPSPLPAADPWETETEQQFFSYSDELAPVSADEVEFDPMLLEAETLEAPTAAQLARRSMFRRAVARAVAGLSVFAIAAATVRLVGGL